MLSPDANAFKASVFSWETRGCENLLVVFLIRIYDCQRQEAPQYPQISSKRGTDHRTQDKQAILSTTIHLNLDPCEAKRFLPCFSETRYTKGSTHFDFVSPTCTRFSIEIVNSPFGKDLARSLGVCGGPHELEFHGAELGKRLTRTARICSQKTSKPLSD